MSRAMACEGEEAMELTCVSESSERESEARGTHNKPLEFCYFYTHSKGDFLQSCIRERIVYKYKPSAIFFSPEPLSAVLAWPRAQLALALLSATWLVFITLKLQSIQSAGYFSLVNEEARVREFSTAAFGRDRELACSWELVLEMFISFLLGVSGLLISILAHTSRIELAKLLMLVTGFVGITTNFIIFVKLTLQGSARSGLRTPSWFFLVNVMTDVLLFPMPLAVNESWVVELVLLDSIVHLSVEFADGQLPYLYMLMATVALSFLLARERMRWRVLREMRQEQEGAWEEEWMKMRGSWALRSLTKALRVGPDYRSFAFGSFGPIVIVSSERRQDEEAELDYIPACNPKTNTKVQTSPDSLDQLYAQAILIEPVFLLKVQALAFASDGYFPLDSCQDSSPEYVRWRDAVRDDTLADRVRWAAIKSASRAIEKLTIVFAGLEELLLGVKAVLDDPELEVVRIKNRLDPGFDSTLSGGYRDVAINVRVLILQDFHALKSMDGHKRYVQFRNIRLNKTERHQLYTYLSFPRPALGA
ncbi:hypothetical protein GUITHDRAFT_103317 [Guillardia theta CCMP2712]|uniref:Uncharacterized protein n=1 Tax=Guillardia theta (strain CCMP2712) TaxID=905079 RepID=L1JQ65_GUITC|nr:hypothetical protein GUITHDRAFT_103317 [Guillardia theta CCMP2712]EKX50726.1 hypothetical protein GUITHDRAFT_103317 [Guillardia theta CCMP2712]|eukprot:XP_005837706.1 hypothetical protein GUITHDRAFT_103317 [Guillardia theta CCMP2712]